MDDSEKILQLIENPALKVDPQWVLDIQERYPAFYLPAALLLARNPESVDDDTRQRLKDSVIINCPDRAALADLVDICDSDWATIYPRADIGQQHTTAETIDTFIETYGTTNTPEEDAVLERLIFNPVAPDYFQDTDEPFDPNDPLALPPELMPESPAKPQPAKPTAAPAPAVAPQPAPKPVPQPTATPQPAPRPIAKPVQAPAPKPQPAPVPKPVTPPQPKPQPTVAQPPEKSDSDPSLMESLAKIFIKQRRYQRAYEIISKLSLNYPEKSVYFADQMRFLQKLMVNQSYSTK